MPEVTDSKKLKTWECNLLFLVEAPSREGAAHWVRDFVEAHLKGKATGLGITTEPIKEDNKEIAKNIGG